MSYVSSAYMVFMLVSASLYFLFPKEKRWLVLLAASYVFFFLNSHALVLVLFGQTLVTFLVALRLQALKDAAPPKRRGKKQSEEEAALAERLKTKRKWLTRLGVIANVATLLFLKYYNFFADTGNVLLRMAGLELPELPLVVPVGISFYTLQAISYVVDVQHDKCVADRSLPQFMLFMSYFPQILQGPIPRYRELAKQLYEGHDFDYTRACYGCQLILWGLIKKLVIADRLAIPVNQIFDNSTYYTGPIVFLAAVGYGLQVYADFSGGIDVSRGFSQIVGITLTDNFRQPYFARSVEEFWRRWHITLGTWMKNYVFYPLSFSKGFRLIGQRSRKVFGASAGKKIPPFMAMFIVYLLVGFWHGPRWSYIAYGVWNGIFIMCGVLWSDTLYAKLKSRFHVDESSYSWALFQMFRTFIIASIGRFMSRASGFMVAFNMARASLVHWWDLSFLVDGSMLKLGLDRPNFELLMVSILVLLLVDIAHERGIHLRESIASQGIVFRWLVYLAAIAVILVFGEYGSAYDSAGFIYQQF